MNKQKEQAFADWITKEYMEGVGDLSAHDCEYNLKDMEKSYMAGYTYARWLQEMKKEC